MTTLLMDISNFDQPFTPETVRCLGDSGFRHFIVGSQRPPIALSQIAAIQAAGASVQGAYAFLYHGLDTLGQTRQAIEFAHIAKAGFVWLDCEATPPHEAAGMTAAQRVAEIHACVSLVEGAGLRAGIYTGGWWWPDNTANNVEFARLPLWHSAYWTDERETRRVSYGGWSDVAIHQFSATKTLCGRQRDRNYVFDESLLEEEMGMTEDERLALFAGKEQLGERPTREARLKYANARIAEIAAGKAPSIQEIAAGAAARVNDGATDYESIGSAIENAGRAIRVKGHGR